MRGFEIGHDAWKGFSESSVGTEKLVRTFEESVHWDNITSFCHRRRDVQCSIGPKFLVGSKNLVKLVEFADGIKWVARLPLPHPDIYCVEGRASNRLKALHSEVATLKFLGSNTAIPVPKIYGFDDGTGEIGAPCIIMEYVHGTPADVLLKGRKGTFGGPQDDEHVLRQLARIMVQLAEVKFYGIGSLYQEANDGSYYVGADIETGEGPFSTPDDYYEALCKHRQARYGMGTFSGNSEMHGPNATLPQMFRNYISAFCKMQHEGPFSLVNTNLGAHSILIDSNFKIVSMIDCEGIIAGPFHMAAQFPVISFIDDFIPGERTSSIDGHTSKAIMRRKAYIDFIWEQSEGTSLHKQTVAMGLAQAMVSDAGQYVRGLCEFKMRSWDRNGRWIRAYEFMYDRMREEQVQEVADPGVEEDDAPNTDGPDSRLEDPGFVEGPLDPATAVFLPVRAGPMELEQE